MRSIPLLLLVGSALSLNACKEDSVAPTTVFGRQWYNTFEQDQADFFTFMLENRAQGRRYDGFRLEKDGHFVEYGLGPADGGQERPGTWTETGKLTYRIRFTDAQLQSYTLQIQEVDGETIKARRIY